jgi:hypothetical protein
MQSAIVIILSLLVAPATAASLRLRADPAKPAAIKAKWEKMDDFLGVMFTMACKWKNGKDVNGLAAEKLKDGEVEGADGYAAFVKETQAKNVVGLRKSCGLIISESKKKCRDGCAASWNQVAQKRNDCDEKCVSVYDNFERSCESKADNLQKVYAQKSAKAAAQKQCYEGHCKEFPMVWMKEKEADQKSEVKTQCDKRCTKENVKIGCQEKWAAEIDYVSVKVNSDCAEKSGVSKCLDGKKKDVSAAYDKCKADTKKTCGDAYKTCTDKGNADKNFKDAKAFCDDRKEVCSKQAEENCQNDNRAALFKAESECNKKAGKELTKCQDDTLKKLETDSEKKCIDKRTPTCKKDCQGSCEVGKMKKCLANLKTDDNPGKVFCQDFWRMLHSSAEVDPVTGDPISLLANPKASTIAAPAP